MPYRSLNADKIEKTIEKLQARIEERFPNRGLGRLCQELLHVAQEDRRKLSWRRRPNILIRASVGLIFALGIAAVAWAIPNLPSMRVDAEAFSALEAAEAAVNIVVLFGAAIWFLMNLESVWRREAVLRDLHELRSLAHVVDMHQLTKDPTTDDSRRTASSPADRLASYDLERYLDYCSEMLALTGKLAALYMQDVRDPVIIQAVNEIEELTTNLSRKIWQKIMILRQPA
jgi:hypothetical protein